MVEQHGQIMMHMEALTADVISCTANGPDDSQMGHTLINIDKMQGKGP